MDARSEQTFVARFQKAKLDSTLIRNTAPDVAAQLRGPGGDRGIRQDRGHGDHRAVRSGPRPTVKAAAEIVKNAVSAQAGKPPAPTESPN